MNVVWVCCAARVVCVCVCARACVRLCVCVRACAGRSTRGLDCVAKMLATDSENSRESAGVYARRALVCGCSSLWLLVCAQSFSLWLL